MIALITSTIFPSKLSQDGTLRNVFSPEIRLKQTLGTIDSLKKHGFTKILILDNSGPNWDLSYDVYFSDVSLLKIDTYQFSNKGINEIHLLLLGLKHLPSDTSILKISGRYKLLWDIKSELKEYDLAIRYFKTNSGRFTMHTSCYLIKNKLTYEFLLKTALEEHYADYARALNKVGIKRFFRNNILKKGDKFSDPPLPIEFSFAKAVNICKLDYKILSSNICEGLAGANPHTLHIH